MMEHSQVRWAILLSFIPLKVRRMKSLALLWATAGPDCRSLKLYWVSAKALTLPISHHGSSQLSLPSGLIPSPERINTQSLCSLYTWAFSLLRSRPRSTSISSLLFFFFWPVLCVSPQMNHPQLYGGTVWVQQKESLPFCTDGHLVILSSSASAWIIVIFVVLDQLPEHWITGEWPPSWHLSNSPPLARPVNEEVWWRGFGPTTGLQV